MPARTRLHITILASRAVISLLPTCIAWHKTEPRSLSANGTSVCRWAKASHRSALRSTSRPVSHLPVVPNPSSPGLTLDCTDVDRPATPPRPSSNVPFRRDPDFVDRPTLLDQLHQKCFCTGGEDCSRRLRWGWVSEKSMRPFLMLTRPQKVAACN